MNESEQRDLGKKMGLAFRYVQQVFRESSALMKYLDILMKDDWVATYGNRITKEVTSHLSAPEYWLVEGVFRIYDSKKEKHIKKGITIIYWEEDYSLAEPVLIAGKLDYFKDEKTGEITKHDHWDLYYSWFKDICEEKLYNGEKIYSARYEKSERNYVREGKIFGLPLVWIGSEQDIHHKVYKKLIDL